MKKIFNNLSLCPLWPSVAIFFCSFPRGANDASLVLGYLSSNPSIKGRTCAFESKFCDCYVTLIAVSRWRVRDKKIFHFSDFWF